MYNYSKPYIYLFVSITCLFVLLVLLFHYNRNYLKLKQIEYMTNNNNNNNPIFLLGDSVLNNSKYVSNNESVYEYVKQKNTNTYLYAKDDSTIVDLYTQLNNIPSDITEEEEKNTSVVISIGGNDILKMTTTDSSTKVNELFQKYMDFLSSLRSKFPSIKQIVLLSLYYPPKSMYHKYYPYIDKWNQLLEENSFKMDYKIIQTNKIMTNTEDFIFDIEPSVKGGEKIANILLGKVYFTSL